MHIEPLHLVSQGEWAQWLAQHHATTAEVWLLHPKKASKVEAVTYAHALEVALCFGWIDSMERRYDDECTMQRWTPRGKRSNWSATNKAKALAYIADGRMQPSGLAEVERAQRDGRWEAS
jgi:uncharacterized protein YdeI (YjbR/CyaY-like superfamily)